MQSHAQFWSPSTQGGGFTTPSCSDEQARASQDSIAMSFDNPAINPAACAKVIAVND